MRSAPRGEADRSFKERLVIHLGLSVSAYAPEHAFGPDYYVEPRLQRHYKTELADLALRAAQSGQLSGRLGLEYAESQIFLDGLLFSENVAYHGSPFDLHIIRPRQASWHDRDITRPRFADGRPAISASKTTKFPAMRAVLHDGHPEIAGQPLVLRKARDRKEKATWFTSEEVLEILGAEGTNGVVYPIRLSVRGDVQEPDFDPDREEYRIYGPRAPLIRVPVGAEALPPDLCVIPADERHKLTDLPKFNNVYRWGEVMHVPVRPLGGLWPNDYAPN
jgi:hypothetical protein